MNLLLGKMRSNRPRLASKSNNATVSRAPSPPALLRHISDESWSSARRELSREIALLKTSDPSELSSQSSSLSSPPLLHPDDLCRALCAACRRQPPLDVIRLILDLCPDAASRPEPCTGRYPLHIALQHAGSKEVVELLVRRNPAAAAVCAAPDESGRTALHELCDTYVRTYRERHQKSVDKTALVLVRLLRCCAPTTTNLEDADGMTAIEYAVLNHMDHTSVRTLRLWSQRDWRNRRKPGYGVPGAQDGLWSFKDDKDAAVKMATATKATDSGNSGRSWMRGHAIAMLKRAPPAA
eukprot:CAMPEP_0197446954 /NCGR_PEP_ID=MMETSP1175-20131217/11742_1 /TAXON_ID=1003142 /ORGANISM="Triceratium dubium, Strain CCMP147" /LENGTH=295 /DNA_ID=CAMNT_0042978131 /DNA_START=152 /DNA_END=1042 /DNA_ORIENTATION=-